MTRRRIREQKRKAKERYNLPPESIHWQEEDEMHFLMPGEPPSEEEIAEITKAYQENIRNSELFEMWVRDFGLAKAIEMLQECRYEVRR